MNDVGFRVKLLREKNSLSQKQFAERIMVSQSYLSRIERGIEIPNNKLIKLIGLEFNVNTSWLSDGKGVPETSDKKLSYDYYDRAYIQEFNAGVKEELENLSKKIIEYNNAEISRGICAICTEVIDMFDHMDNTLRAIIGESITSIILGLCEQLNKFDKIIDLESFKLIKINCIDNLYHELNVLEEYICNKDLN